MKKFLSILLLLAIVLTVAACSKGKKQSNSDISSISAEISSMINSEQSTVVENSSKEESTKVENVQSVESENASDAEKPPKPSNVSSKPKENSKPAHTHTYTKATCTTPGKCSCGAVQGKALGHIFENGICTVCKVVDEDKYVAAQIDAAEKTFTDYTKYQAALKIIKAALQKCPQSSVLKTKRDYYQSFAPINLCDLEPFQESYAYINGGNSSDNFGNSYENCAYKPYYNSSASATYDLNYKYNSFKATIFSRSDTSAQTYGTVTIYGDNEVLYQKKEIDVYSRPFSISVDVTGIQDLKIVIESTSGAHIFGLGNCILQRTAK